MPGFSILSRVPSWILTLLPISTLQIITQVQKLELNWPPQIQSFFSTLNLLSLSFTALSPRCVVSEWNYLDKIIVTNLVPIAIYCFLLAYQIVGPRLNYAAHWLGRKLMSFAKHKHEPEGERPGITGIPAWEDSLDAISSSRLSWYTKVQFKAEKSNPPSSLSGSWWGLWNCVRKTPHRHG